MFPRPTQRVMIAVAAVVAGLIYLQGADVARAADGSDGSTLLFSESPLLSVAVFAALSIPAVLLGAVASATGNPLGGVFAVAVALVFPAVAGGTIDDWLRNAEGPGAYWLLFGETIIWTVLMAVLAVGCIGLGWAMRGKLPPLRRRDHRPSEDRTHRAPALVPRRGPAWDLMGFILIDAWIVRPPLSSPEDASAPASERVTWRDSLGGLLVAAVAGGMMAWLLLRSADTWQVVWGLAIAFTIGGLLAHQMFPAASPLALLLSPLVAAMVWYVWAAVRDPATGSMLADYFRGRFPPAALGLPAYYVSAGVAGAVTGIAWSQTLLRAQHEQGAHGGDDPPASPSPGR